VGSPLLLGLSLALAAAGLWGAGDLSGGLGVRRGHPFGVLLISLLSGIVLLGVAWLVWPQGRPASADLLWGLCAGAAGSLGLAALYTGLGRSQAAVVAPATAVVGATIPVSFGLATQGLLAPPQLAGIAAALLGLWFVSASKRNSGGGSTGLVHGILAGVGVGVFLIAMAQVSPGSVLAPLIAARFAGVVVAGLVLFITRTPWPGVSDNPWALCAGLFDAGGNLLYLLAVHRMRIELAVVISSLYPAVTVLLAARFMHQRVGGRQWLGVALCLAGVGLLSWS
jgi:drug/metabolite transporter (DMT)-like permease